MSMFYALTALCLAGSALAQVPGLGACPKNLTVQADFDVSQFYGRWYEHSRFFHSAELIARCNVVDYSPCEDGSLKLTNSFISGFTGKTASYDVSIQIPNPEEPARMTVKMPKAPFDKTSSYLILGTDYENYAVVYVCSDYEYMNLKYAWILTRERNPSSGVLAKANEIVYRNKVRKSHFWKVEQKRCWEKPEEV